MPQVVLGPASSTRHGMMAQRRADCEEPDEETFAPELEPEPDPVPESIPRIVQENKSLLSPREKYQEAINNAIEGPVLGDVKVGCT